MAGLVMTKQEKRLSITREAPDYVLAEDAFLRSESCNFCVGDFSLYFDHASIYLTVKTKENSNKQHNIPQTPVIKAAKVLWNPDAIDEIKKKTRP